LLGGIAENGQNESGSDWWLEAIYGFLRYKKVMGKVYLYQENILRNKSDEVMPLLGYICCLVRKNYFLSWKKISPQLGKNKSPVTKRIVYLATPMKYSYKNS